MNRHGRRGAQAGDLLELVALDPGGLGVLADGTLIRAYRVGALNPLLQDAETVEQHSRALAGALARIPAGQSAHFYVQSQPLSVSELFTTLADANDKAASAAGGARGEALQRLGACERDSLSVHVPRLAASTVSHYMVVPWRAPVSVIARLRPGRRATRPVMLAEHTRRAAGHARYADALCGALGAAGLPVSALDADQLVGLLWQRFNPQDADDGTPAPAGLHGPLARSAAAAGAQARALRAEIAARPIAGRRLLRIGDQVEQVLAVTGTPDQTWLGWLMYLMGAPLPWALSVHITATDRLAERLRARRRFKRLYGVNRGTELRGRPLDPESRQREDEAALLNDTLAASAGAGIYQVAIYLALRHPSGDQSQLAGELDALAKELVVSTDAHADSGGLGQRERWQATLPLGHDPARRRRRYVTVNGADSVPLVGYGCGSPLSPTWLALGYSQPGRTLEGIDPFDPSHANHLTVIAGQSGAGKTMTTNLLLARALARGAHGDVIDRAGHYEFLVSLIPGAAAVSLGNDAHTINPWDGSWSAAKSDALVRFHELLIGDHDRHIDEHGLNALQRAQLTAAIRRVYDHCTAYGERPRESLLREQLVRMHHEALEDRDAERASVLRLLAETLAPYCADGPYAYLADRPTTVPADAPLVVYDTRALSDDVAPAALFVVIEHAVRKCQARRASHLAGGHDLAPWAGRSFLVVDEAWKLLARRATGRWVNDLARRSRHLALWMVAISQQLSDFTGKEGEALLSQSTVRLLLKQQPDQLAFIRQALGLSGEELQAIGALSTAKREHATCYLRNGSRGAGVLTICVSEREYWLATSDPVRDEPARQAALRAANGNPWEALDLLADPDRQPHQDTVV